MRSTLRASTKNGLRQYVPQERVPWLLAQTAQLALTLSSIFWCQNVTAILSSNTAQEQLRTHAEELAAQLAALADVCKAAKH